MWRTHGLRLLPRLRPTSIQQPYHPQQPQQRSFLATAAPAASSAAAAAAVSFHQPLVNNNNNSNNVVVVRSESDAAVGSRLFGGISRLTEHVLVRGRGCEVETDRGERLLDFTAGIAVLSTGYCHPKVVSAIQKQCSEMILASVFVGYHQPGLQLLQELDDVLPEPLNSFFLWNSGAEAIEMAVKTARMATRRPNLIVFQGGFHGRTFGTMSFTTSKSMYKAGYGALLSNVFVAPFPYARQLPKQLRPEEMSDYCIECLENVLRQQTCPEDTAAMLVEPIQGENGYVVPPDDFLPKLAALCKKHNILLIFDEVQCGFGRTGKMFAFEHYGVVPDLLVMAKGIASGLPLSCVATRKEISDLLTKGSVGGTYAGNPVSCAAALATLEVIREEKLCENAAARGAELMAGLMRLQKEKGYPIKVRGKGLMVGVEMDPDFCEPGTAMAISKQCVKEGLLLMTAGSFESLRFMPPLVVNSHQIQQCLQKFERAMAAVLDDQGSHLLKSSG